MRLATGLVLLLTAGAGVAAPPVVGSGVAVELPVPAKATVVLQVNGWEKARGRLHELVEKAVPADAKTVKTLVDAQLSDLLDGRELKGLDPDARIFASLNNLQAIGDDAIPADVFFPVKDANAFRDGLFRDSERKDAVKKANGVTSLQLQGHAVFLVEKTNLVVITASEDRATEYAGKYETLNTKRMGPDVAATFLNADVSLYIDLEKVNEQFGDEIKQFRGIIDFAFQNAGAAAPGLDKSQIDTIKEMMKGLFQVIEDGRAFVAAVEFRPEGLNVRLQGRFDKESKTGKVLAAEVPQAFEKLAVLPHGFTDYHASRFGPAIEEPVGKLAREFSAGEGQDEAAVAVDKYFEAKKAGLVRGTRSASKGVEASITVTECDDSAAVVAAHLALLKSLPAGSSYSSVVIKEKPKVQESVQTYKGLTLHQVTLALDLEETAKKSPEPARETALATLKKQWKEKTNYWIGSGGGVIVQVTAADWEAAKKVLEGTATDGKVNAPFQVTRSQLPAEVSYLALQDVVHVIDELAEGLGGLGQSIPGIPFEFPKVTKVKADPSYVGIAVVLKPEVGQFDIFVPAAAIGTARRAFQEK